MEIGKNATRKAVGVAAHLFRNPGHIADYLRGIRAVAGGSLPLGLPWFSYAAIEYLDDYLNRRSVVLEYGSGGSTIFFAERAKSVVSVENDAHWASRVRNSLAQRGLTNADVKLVDSALDGPESLYSSGFIGPHKVEKPGVISIDSWDYESHTLRPIIFAHAFGIVSSSGIVILDDFWRYEDACPAPPGWKVRVFRGLGPARRTLTSTAVFERA